MTISAVAVDDSTVIRESLPLLMPEIRFVGRYATVERLLVERPTADLAVLDLHLVNERQPSVRQGLAAVRAVVAAGYRVCVYSQEERRFVLAACIAAGAGGIVAKSAPLAEVQESFRDVAAGRVVVPQSIISLMEILVRRNCITIIGERQRQVLAARARGLTYAEMSTKLFLSESTLRGYWRDLTLNVSSYLQQTTPHDIEHALGLKPGDLLDFWPMQPASTDRPGAEWWKLTEPS
ncbi:response regulator transcription factor [Nocardioides limicola]|uniref:response regulator transcription factor n=1 Tax=Nocardioides limicola TaxID=2803368 RepID=UPI00193B33CE|nr:response regulator transcription factor [Nocardioides sp. DJM-14]